MLNLKRVRKSLANKFKRKIHTMLFGKIDFPYTIREQCLIKFYASIKLYRYHGRYFLNEDISIFDTTFYHESSILSNIYKAKVFNLIDSDESTLIFLKYYTSCPDEVKKCFLESQIDGKYFELGVLTNYEKKDLEYIAQNMIDELVFLEKGCLDNIKVYMKNLYDLSNKSLIFRNIRHSLLITDYSKNIFFNRAYMYLKSKKDLVKEV